MLLFLSSLNIDEKKLVADIYKNLNKKMFNLAFSILKNKTDAEEAVSNAFIRIMENIDKISNLKCHETNPYCVTILRNEIMNIYRDKKKYMFIEDIDLFQNKIYQNSLEEEVIKKLEIEKLESYLKTLNKEEKLFVFYRYSHKLGYKNIATLLNISEEAARKRNQRLIEKLKKYLEGGDKNNENH